MMKAVFKCLLLCTAIFSVENAYAITETCLQAPDRTQACPHTIIKRSPVDVPSMNVAQGEAICICLADFEFLRETPDNDVKRIAQQNQLRRITAELNIEEQTLRNLLSYRTQSRAN